MRYASSIALGLLQIASVYATSPVVLETNKDVPDGWMFKSFPPGNTSLGISIALTQPRLADLEAVLLQGASSHSQSQTPALFSFDQIAAFQKPADDAASTVISWLNRHGVTGAVADGPWVKANTTVEALHSLFDADMAYYTYNGSTAGEREHTVLRTLSYSIPDSLSSYVDFVYPLAHFMPPRGNDSGPKQNNRRRLSRRGSLRSSAPVQAGVCEPNAVSPNCIRAVYNWPPTLRPKSISPARLGVAGFLEEYINFEDVSAFFHRYGLPLPGFRRSRLRAELINGGVNAQKPRVLAGLEASLDVQYSMALSPPAQVSFYSTGGRGEQIGDDGHLVGELYSTNEPFLFFLGYLLSLPDSVLPHVLSISYSDDEQSVPRPYAARVCQLFMQLAARGTTVLVASGDGGGSGIGHDACKRNDGSGRQAMLPTFPASCPWVTAVGATDSPIVEPYTSVEPYSRASIPAPPKVAAYYSSGGFSNYFDRPAWQNESVHAYISGQAGQDKEGLFNQSGRAIPDIAAMGSGFEVISGGWMTSVDGTSASTPVVAAMVMMANDARLRAGKPPLGWLNPILYLDVVQRVLQDITEGVSRGCAIDKTQVTGWPATPGWDAVTGLGVPSDVTAFVKILSEV